MPSNPRERRSRVPRRLPPRPAINGQSVPATESVEQPVSRGRSLRAGRSARLLERETPFVMQELKRVAGVSVVTIGLLIALTVIDRVR